MNGLNQIYLGDCLEVMKRIPDQSIDMILCDLPYGTTACKWDTIIPLDLLWLQYTRILKPGGNIVLTASQPFTSALVMSNPKLFKYEWIWEKNTGSNFATLRFGPFKQHESVLVFGGSKTQYFPIMQPVSESTTSRKKYAISESAISGTTETNGHKRGYAEGYNEKTTRNPSSVQKFNRETGLHPTQKPVKLFEYLIRTYTNEGQLVLDNCIGSGTTAIAAMNTGRNWIGIEKDPEIYAKAVQRVANHGTAEV